MFENPQQFNKLWGALAGVIVWFLVNKFGVPADLISKEAMELLIIALIPVVVGAIPNKKQLSSGETVNVADIKNIVDVKEANAEVRVAKAEAGK